jgi:hypothetical protein
VDDSQDEDAKVVVFLYLSSSREDGTGNVTIAIRTPLSTSIESVHMSRTGEMVVKRIRIGETYTTENGQ